MPGYTFGHSVWNQHAIHALSLLYALDIVHMQQHMPVSTHPHASLLVASSRKPHSRLSFSVTAISTSTRKMAMLCKWFGESQ
jgi:hypothetical protein